AQRGIIEFRYRWPGQYMFHAHQSEFAELGWMGNFNVVAEDGFPDALAAAGVSSDWDERSTNGDAALHVESGG
ncbi:MAG: multicopper oxidase domain-containing protein, partial [Caldilineaceae bacterium]|nr:multicopper oxidase domain-containing protein [Caldilineaceae bacterium]